MEQETNNLMVQLLEKRIARVRKGLFITGAIFAGLNALVALKWFLQDQKLHSEGSAGAYFNFWPNAFMIAMCFVASWILSLQYSWRVRRTGREGELVAGRITGEPGVWGNEILPPSGSAVWSVVRNIHAAIMHSYSRILPTLNVGCEIDIYNKKHGFLSHLFGDEEPVQTNDGEVIVLVLTKKISSWPGPWIITMAPDDPDREVWMSLLNQKIQPGERTEKGPMIVSNLQTCHIS